CRRRIESSCRSTRISSSFDPDDRQQTKISSNRRRTTKYASDHNTRHLHQMKKPKLPAHCLSDLPDRVFDPHGVDLATDYPANVVHAGPLGVTRAPQEGSTSDGRPLVLL